MENNRYINGFNHGYLLAKYKPILLKGLFSAKSTNEYFLGILEGKQEFEQSRIKSRSQELNKLHRLKGKNCKKGLER